MLDQPPALPSNSQLQLIYRNMLLHANREVPKLDNLSTCQKNKIISEGNNIIAKQTALIRAIGSQISALLLDFMNYRQTVEESLDELNEESQRKSIDMENLQEAVTHLEKKVQIYKEQYGKLKNVSQMLADTQTSNQLIWTQQKKKLEQSIESLKDSIVFHSSKASQLVNQKDLLLSQLAQERAKAEEITRQLTELKASMQQKDEMLLKKDKNIAQLNREKQKITANYDFCSKVLKTYQEQMKREDYMGHEEKAISQKAPKRMTKYHLGNEIPQCQYKNQKLSDKLPFTPFYEFSWSYLRCESKRALKIQNQLQCLSLDPYFAHFVLTSQSVKIREDCQELLNIDVKPYYNEIVERRVPMHMWDQWIRNKLRELHRRCRKRSSGFTSEDEFC